METSDKRVYVLGCKKEESFYVMGVYTNKKVLLEAINLLGLDGCYIKAKTKNVPVTAGSLHTHFTDRIIIYKKDENGEETLKFKAIEVKLNKFNSIVREKFSNIADEYFS